MTILRLRWFRPSHWSRRWRRPSRSLWSATGPDPWKYVKMLRWKDLRGIWRKSISLWDWRCGIFHHANFIGRNKKNITYHQNRYPVTSCQFRIIAGGFIHTNFWKKEEHFSHRLSKNLRNACSRTPAGSSSSEATASGRWHHLDFAPGGSSDSAIFEGLFDAEKPALLQIIPS